MTAHKKPTRKPLGTGRASASALALRTRKPSSILAPKRITSDSYVDEDPEFALSFLQFCMHCETQLPFPHTGLYCSARCKHADGASSAGPLSSSPTTSYAPITPAYPSPPTSPVMATHEEKRPHHYRTATGSSSSSTTSAYSIDARPLPPRSFGSFSRSPKSVELVTPWLCRETARGTVVR